MQSMPEWQRNLNLSRSPQMSIIGTSRKRDGGSNDNSKSSSENNSASEYPTEVSKPEEPMKPEEMRALRMKHINQTLNNSSESEKSRILSSALGNAFKNMKKQHQTLSKKALDKQLQDLKVMLETQKLLAEEAAKFKKKLQSRKVPSLHSSDDTNAFFIAEEEH
eukprot:CAMPEP_0168565496 /NCGR_PEP_ID=MMETSP0413-20121227/13878_1 /TAXON_ID=136452 /ORGANISM="Filamoeba nolandi, Strain NC-AS-23-1" /LENGTH=163 /DNA_ID=CAMNT_0008597375 /DNA_START=141 /DNA_END=632 /DNA_ORIENTATION=+